MAQHHLESRYKDFGTNHAKEALEQAAKYLYLVIGLNILLVMFITVLVACSAALWAIMTVGLVILALTGLILLIRFLRRAERRFEDSVELLTHFNETGEDVRIDFMGGILRIDVEAQDRHALDSPHQIEERE